MVTFAKHFLSCVRSTAFPESGLQTRAISLRQEGYKSQFFFLDPILQSDTRKQSHDHLPRLYASQLILANFTVMQQKCLKPCWNPSSYLHQLALSATPLRIFSSVPYLFKKLLKGHNYNAKWFLLYSNVKCHNTSSQRACQWWWCPQNWSLWVNYLDPTALCQ